MEIKAITNKDEWEGFLSPVSKEEKTFLHSWQWGCFQILLKERIWRLGIYEQNVLVGVCLVVAVKAKRGNFLLIPHGPIIEQKAKSKRQNSDLKPNKDLIQELVTFLRTLAKQEKCCFIRVATTWSRTEENENIFKELGFEQAPFHTHPELTWILNLEKSEEELLSQMRKTTRYLIKQGIKMNELKIEKSINKEDVLVFNKIYQETAHRHDFTPFSLNYLNKELEAFSPDNILILKAIFKGELLASSMIIFWQGIGFYHQGASTDKKPKAPAAYLMQWQAIKEAKQRGCLLYNFWGIADLSSKFKVQSSKFKKHPWAGLSLFKMGFGGHQKEYLKTQDLPLSKRYYLTRYFELLRKWKRRL